MLQRERGVALGFFTPFSLTRDLVVANPPVTFFSIFPCRRRLFLKVVTNERRQKKTKISDVIRYMEFNVY